MLYVISLEVLDFEENSMVELLKLSQRNDYQSGRSSIPSQKDIDKWSHLDNVKLQSSIHQLIIKLVILIGNDAHRSLEPREVRRCDGRDSAR